MSVWLTSLSSWVSLTEDRCNVLIHPYNMNASHPEDCMAIKYNSLCLLGIYMWSMRSSHQSAELSLSDLRIRRVSRSVSKGSCSAFNEVSQSATFTPSLAIQILKHQQFWNGNIFICEARPLVLCEASLHRHLFSPTLSESSTPGRRFYCARQRQLHPTAKLNHSQQPGLF